MDRLITHIYFSPFTHESRAMRAISAALDNGLADQAEAIGYLDDGLVAVEQLSENVEIRRWKVDFFPRLPRLIRRSIAWAVWTWKTGRHVGKSNSVVVQAHSLAAMPAAVLAKATAGTPILYDAHELETERAGWGKLQKALARILERAVIRQADAMIVVSGTIADWYADHYSIERPGLVRNIPARAAQTQSPSAQNMAQKSSNALTIRKSLKLSDNDILYVYLGDIGYGRGILELIEAFKTLPPHIHFCALGYGEYADRVVAASAAHPNIHYHKAVPSGDVLRFIKDADVGVSLGEDICLSYRYSLPNKLFETRLAGLPVLASTLPEMANFVRTFGGGWVVEPAAGPISALIGSLDHEQIRAVAANAKPVPTWEDDIPVYLDSLNRALSPRARGRPS